MPLPQRQVQIWHDADADTFSDKLVPAHRPAVLTELVKDWPAVLTASTSAQEACAYLARFYKGSPVRRRRRSRSSSCCAC